MDAHDPNGYRASYDQIADEYVRRIFDELQYKPLVRQLLDRFATNVRSARLVTQVADLVTLLVTCTSKVFRFAALTCRQ
jgi:hypothetical protein